MFRWVRQLLGGGTASPQSTASHRVTTGREWKWDRTNEYQYDHYTDAVDDIKQLKRDRRHDEVIALLNWCIDYTEAEAEADGPISNAPAPTYYRHLGIVLRKEGRYSDEVALLEDYIDWFDQHSGTPDEGLIDRLEKARELAAAEE
ncbi:hypothetical protein BV210_18440 (plasmid) [Halorientalis sp. IM1011]|uniref:hypothetical protein n=1 Tax=Halorientalis sp. IM1011 TaxID=1932360 RepID=UPI00097CC9CF|nr:hypothetical protein [Halorientalis sp. IM1011]AQL44729.1 hypothetical protein BV210_18440 [Halorientalis sp. IM1011]